MAVIGTPFLVGSTHYNGRFVADGVADYNDYYEIVRLSDMGKYFHSFLRPAVVLLDRLLYPMKFLLITIIFSIPFVWLLTNYTFQEIGEIRNIGENKKGLEEIGAVREVLFRVQDHSTIAYSILSGLSLPKDRLEEVERSVDQAVEVLLVKNASIGSLYELGNSVPIIQSDWLDLKQRGMGLLAGDNLYLHNELEQKMIAMMQQIADTSRLSLQSHLTSYYLTDSVIHQYPDYLEALSSLHSLSVGWAFSSGTGSEITWSDKMTNVDGFRNRLESNARILIADNPDWKRLIQQEIDDNHLAALRMKESVQGDPRQKDVSSIYAEGDKAIQTGRDGLKYESDLLAQELADLKTKAVTRLVGFSLLFLAAMSIAAYLFTAFYFSLNRNISLLRLTTRKVAEGDLSVQLPSVSKDEMNSIFESFQAMVRSFREILHQIRNTADVLSDASSDVRDSAIGTRSAGELLSTSSEAVKIGADFQLDNAKAATLSMDEVTRSITHIAQISASVDEEAIQTFQAALEGSSYMQSSSAQMDQIREAIRQTVQVMEKLDSHIKQIGEVSMIIHRFSKETQILALNAGIESARLGSEGKGFAVIAVEIKSLSEKTRDSALQIGALVEEIQDAAGEVSGSLRQNMTLSEEGITLIRSTNDVFSGIHIRVERIAERIQEVSAASEEVSAAAEQFSVSLSDNVRIARNSAESSEKTFDVLQGQFASVTSLVQSAEQMKVLAESLNDMLSHFQIEP